MRRHARKPDGSCCCGQTSCCDTPGGPPTADFSYSQTSDDPCSFSFTDESVAGSCGSIVSWEWDFGDGNTSTSQNPTHAYSGSYPSGPWDVTLTVTDSEGCEDSVVMSVSCEVLAVCPHCTQTMPSSVSVGIPSGVSSFVYGACLTCKSPGTYTLPPEPGVECCYLLTLPKCREFDSHDLTLRACFSFISHDTGGPGGGAWTEYGWTVTLTCPDSGDFLSGYYQTWNSIDTPEDPVTCLGSFELGVPSGSTDPITLDV
jgi:hypothetical protein